MKYPFVHCTLFIVQSTLYTVICKDVVVIILVTRINKVTQFYVNEDMIEFIEETPDTMLSLNTGKKIAVMETAIEVIEKIRAEKILIRKATQF